MDECNAWVTTGSYTFDVNAEINLDLKMPGRCAWCILRSTNVL